MPLSVVQAFRKCLYLGFLKAFWNMPPKTFCVHVFSSISKNILNNLWRHFCHFWRHFKMPRIFSHVVVRGVSELLEAEAAAKPPRVSLPAASVLLSPADVHAFARPAWCGRERTNPGEGWSGPRRQCLRSRGRCRRLSWRQATPRVLVQSDRQRRASYHMVCFIRVLGCWRSHPAPTAQVLFRTSTIIAVF